MTYFLCFICFASGTYSLAVLKSHRECLKCGKTAPDSAGEFTELPRPLAGGEGAPRTLPPLSALRASLLASTVPKSVYRNPPMILVHYGDESVAVQFLLWWTIFVVSAEGVHDRLQAASPKYATRPVMYLVTVWRFYRVVWRFVMLGYEWEK